MAGRMKAHIYRVNDVIELPDKIVKLLSDGALGFNNGDMPLLVGIGNQVYCKSRDPIYEFLDEHMRRIEDGW